MQDWLKRKSFYLPYDKDAKELNKFEQGEFILMIYWFIFEYFLKNN